MRTRNSSEAWDPLSQPDLLNQFCFNLQPCSTGWSADAAALPCAGIALGTRRASGHQAALISVWTSGIVASCKQQAWLLCSLGLFQQSCAHRVCRGLDSLTGHHWVSPTVALWLWCLQDSQASSLGPFSQCSPRMFDLLPSRAGTTHTMLGTW